MLILEANILLIYFILLFNSIINGKSKNIKFYYLFIDLLLIFAKKTSKYIVLIRQTTLNEKN